MLFVENLCELDVLSVVRSQAETRIYAMQM
jgi:hypothetical protein